MLDKRYFIKVIKNIGIFVTTLLLIYLSFKLAIFYVPFLIGFIISLLTEPIIRFICNKTSLTRRTSAIIVLLCIFAILISLIVWGIVTVISESTNLLQNINSYIEKIYTQIQKYLSYIDLSKIEISSQVISIIENFTNNVLEFISNWTSSFLTSLLQGIALLPKIGIYTIITILSTYFICTDKFYIIDQFEHHLPRKWVRKIGSKTNKTVMIPWAIISSVNGDIKLGISIFALYVIVLVIHQILEPKIVSNNLGIHPIFTLIAMYTGFKITGIIGLFIGPIVLIILQNIFETMIDNGIVKTILEKG